MHRNIEYKKIAVLTVNATKTYTAWIIYFSHTARETSPAVGVCEFPGPISLETPGGAVRGLRIEQFLSSVV